MSLRLLIAFLFASYPKQSIAFPENFRKGYTSCASCHVAPSGGGTLTPYGRMTAEDAFSMFSYEGSSEPSLGLFYLPEWLGIGGDIRTLTISRENIQGSTFKKFLMQADLEVALHLSDQISIVGSAGVYNLPLPLEPFIDVEYVSKKHYLLLKPSKRFSLRAGTFMPAYGLLLDDHSANIRQGLFFGSSGERLNLELGLYGSKGEVIAALVLPDEEKNKIGAFAGRASWYINAKNQLGFSLFYQEDDSLAAGVFLMTSLGPLYSLSEYDIKYIPDPFAINYYTYSRLGAEIIEGLNIFILYTNTSTATQDISTLGYGFQLMPFPHLEILGKYESSRLNKQESVNYLLMFHYYI